MLYPIAIIQQDNLYHGRLPDIPELMIEGASMADTIANARQAVITHLQRLAEDDLPFPVDSDISTHLSGAEYAGWTWAIVSLDATRIVGEAVEVTLDIPERLMQKIQTHIKAENTDLQSFFIDLAKQALLLDNQ